MKRDEWENIEELFHAARGIEAEKRNAFLDEACAGDAGLRLRVERLLAENPDADSLLGKPAIDFVSAMLSADTPQTIPSGSLLEHYRILSVVGAGGMGTVYRARDLKLDRDVAIKVLPPAFTMDPERLSRFQREARILASLNHSNIGAIHGLTEGVGVRALVLELVEGPTLADRLQSGPIPVKEALMIARQVADALDAAHSSGVIHRDLKPANIKLRPDGTVKVLDFGIAKAGSRDEAGSNLTSLPTGTVESTREGVILGTPAYMSPEQARGQSLDKRADIWAFGCVLYEMLTGRRAFSGATITDIIAAILEREPDWQLLPSAIPPNVTRLVRRCLEKDPRQRLRDIADARFELSDQPDSVAISTTVSGRRQSRWRTVLLAAAAVAISVVGTWFLTTPPSQPRLVERTLISIAPAVDFGRPPTTGLALSPDGRLIVFSAGSPRAVGAGSETMLYKRPIDNLDAEPIIGTERGSSPVLSPDGSAVAFAARGKLMRIDLRDGALPEELASVSGQGGSVGLSWFSNNDILFADFGRGLSRTQPNGKKPIEVTTVDSAKSERHLFPVVLPDDETILFTIVTSSGFENAQIVAQSLSNGRRQTLIEGGADARFIPPGYLVYMKSDTLMAATFNPKTWETGQGVPVLENVRVSLAAEFPGQQTSAGQFAVSAAGHLVYVGGGSRPDPVSTMVWVDRHGTPQPIEAPVRLYTSPRLSHDGNRVAYNTQRGPERDIWIHNFSAPQSPSRQTFRYENTSPIWSPDDTRLAFSSTENSLRNVFGRLVDGKTGPKPLADPPTVAGAARDPMSWRNGYILFTERHTDGTRSIMLLAEGQTQPTVWMEPQGDYAFRFPEFSPDGRYVAYGSNESRKWEVYIRPFQGDGPRVQVSEGGGTEPVWAASRGTFELFYRSRGKVMAAEISTTPVLKVRKRIALFDDIYEVVPNRPNRNYDVTPDGTQFLMVKANPNAPEPPAAYIIKVTNWIEELKSRLGPTN